MESQAKGSGSSKAVKLQRVLACVQCQSRKVKCNRKFPCANCIKSQVQCIPAAALPARPRRRRFPEKDLLDRLRRYETLLQDNNIEFEPLHQDRSKAVDKESLSTVSGKGSHDSPADDQSSSRSTTAKVEGRYEAKDIWHAMNQKDQDESSASEADVNETILRDAQAKYHTNDHLLFDSRETMIDLLYLHPSQIHIFRLWQIYIDNVNPLLRFIHVPSFQTRILDATSNMSEIKPSFVALLFGIYCISILTLSEEDCVTTFGERREDLLNKYQFGCQQALLNAGFLRSSEKDCLMGLYLYLISIRGSAHAQSVSSVLGVAIRLAQRIGIHSEQANLKYPALEAEVRRRLWWSLILFDARICEVSLELKSTFLLPTWDCAIPSNINDVDFSLAMKDPPTPAEKPTEVIFPVVRAEIGNVIRNSLFHLEFVNPVLKGIVKVPENGEGKELEILGKELQEKYLKWMNEEIPPHFLTLHSSRHFLAKARLVQYYATFSPSPHFHRHSSTSRQSLPHCTHTDRDLAIHHALTMLKEDTILLSTPSMKPYNWYFQQHFPFAAYVHIIQDMKKRPDRSWVEEAWMVMSENYFARGLFLAWESNPFFKIFARMVCGAWAVCERHRERSKRGEQIECREHNLRFGDEMGEGEGEGGGVKIGERKQRELPKVVKDVQEKLELQEIGLEFGNVSEWLDSGLSQQEMGQQELTNTIQRIESDGNGMTGLNQEFNELDLDLSPMEWIRVLTTGNGV